MCTRVVLKSFPRLDAEMELTALRQVQHLERLFVRRSNQVEQTLDDGRLQALLQLPHIRRSLRGVYFSHKKDHSKRPMFNACDGYVPPTQSDRAFSKYLSLPTLQLMGALPHLHTLCIDDAGTAYGVLPMLHKYMPQLTTLALMESVVSPELPSSDVMSIGLCPRLHTLLITGSRRWNTSRHDPDAGHFFLPFFSQPMLQRNLRRLHLIGHFQCEDVLLPALRGLRALRTVACTSMQSEILSALVELTREDRPHDHLQIRPHPPHQSSTSSASDHAKDCPGADGHRADAEVARSQVRDVVIFGEVNTFTRLYSRVPTGSPLMVYFRTHCAVQFTPVESVWRFQAAQQMSDVERVHWGIGAGVGTIDPAHLARLVVCPLQPQMYGPAHLHRSLTIGWRDLLRLDWVRFDRAHIVPCTLPAAVAPARMDTTDAVPDHTPLVHDRFVSSSSLVAAAAGPVEQSRHRCSVGTCTRQFSSEAALEMHHQAKHTQKPVAAGAATVAPTRPTSSCPQQPAFTFAAIGAGFTVGVSSSPSGGVGAALSTGPVTGLTTTTGTVAAADAITTLTPARVIVKARRRMTKATSGDGGGSAGASCISCIVSNQAQAGNGRLAARATNRLQTPHID